MDVQAQDFIVYRGEDWNQPWVPDPDATSTSLSGATLAAYLTDTAGTVIKTLTQGAGITVTDAAAGKFTTAVARADTLTLTGSRYKIDVWRTDTDKRIAGGTIAVKTPQRPLT